LRRASPGQQDPSIAYAAGVLATYHSEDGGNTWLRFGDEQRDTWGPAGLWPGIPIDLQTDPENCSRVFINNYVGGNFLSTDGGQTWELSSDGYSGAKVRDLWVDPQDPAHVYAAVRMAPFVSHDGGGTWEGLSDATLKTSLGTLVGDPADPEHLLGTKDNPGRPAGHFQSRDGGRSWRTLESLQPPPGVTEADWFNMEFWDYAFAPSNPNLVYSATLNVPFPDMTAVDAYPGMGIYRSTDGGGTWQPANDANTQAQGFGAIAVHPSDPQTIYAASFFEAGVFKTTDGGTNWTTVTIGLPQPYPSIETMAIDANTPDTIFIGGRSGAFRSTDGGGSWVQLAAGLDPFSGAKAIVIDPRDSGNVYVGTSRLGAFYSTDGGDTFQQLRQGLDPDLGAMPVMSMAISHDGSVLYAGTAGHGVWRLGTPPSAPASTATAAPTFEVGTAESPPLAPSEPSAAPRPALNWVYVGLGAGVTALAVIAFLLGRRSRR